MPDVTVTPTVQSVTVTPTVQSVSTSSHVGVAAADIDPSVKAFLYSDFNGNCEPFDICTGTATQIGTATFSYTNSASIAVLGYLDMICPKAQGSRVGVFAADADTTDVDRTYNVGYGAWDWSARVQFALGDQPQRVVAGFGITHGPADTTVEQKRMLQYGAAFVAYGNSGNWIATIADNNVLTEYDTGISSSQWRTLRIAINAAFTEINFYVDHALVHTVTSGFWDASANTCAWGVELREKKSGGSLTDSRVLVDFMKLTYTIAR